MSFKYVRPIPEAEEIIKLLPLSKELAEIKKQRDNKIKDIFTGKSDKFLVIIGPCSADNEEAMVEYTLRLAQLQVRVDDKLVLLPRVYTNKPRTTGEGYKGMMHQPNPHNEPHIVAGIKALRRMHLRILKESGLTAADEMLYPGNYPYLEDILSYVAIGARSVENQEHRLTVSGFDIPAGMKNPTSGDLNVMLNSVNAAQVGHTFIYNGWEVKTTGNKLAHCIIRGAIDHNGQNYPNYHYEDLIKLTDVYLKRNLENPAIIIDTNHANSGKKYKEQGRIAKEVMHSMRSSQQLSRIVKGLMIESYLVEGSQGLEEKVFGKSITDPCLGWDDSKRLVLEIEDKLQ